MNSRTIALATLLLTSTLFAKPTYLPPLELKSKASNDVQAFLNGEKLTADTVIKKSSARDILGRIKKSSNNGKNEAYYVMRPQRTLDVHISPIQASREIQPVSGRFEINANGEKKYWLDGNRISEEDYFRNVENRREEFVPEQQYQASLTASEIEALLNGPDPVFIDIVREPIFDYYTDYTVIFGYSEITSHAHSNGYKGQGIGIYFDEYGCSNPVGYNSGYYVLVNTCTHGYQMHPTAVATTLSKTAPMATLYAQDGSGAGNLSNLNMDAYNPSIEISSHSWHYSTNGVYSSYDKIFDNYIYNNGLISFVASGNIKDDDTTTLVGSPGLALNTIAVGAIDPSNNNFASYSKWRNSNVGNQKPEMGNYAEFLFPVSIDIWNGKFAGTSASTPYSAAMIADLLSQQDFYKRHPELVKALIISGEKIPIGNAYTYDADNYSKAARGIIRASSIIWNHRLAYWSGSNSCCFDNNNKITFTESGISSGVHYRIAIAWLTSGDYVISNNTISQDIDLRVYQNGVLLDASISAQNPFEVVDFTTTSSSDLTVEIHRYANSGSDNVILGYSFWNDL